MGARSDDEVASRVQCDPRGPGAEPEVFETRQLDPDDPLVPDFATFRAARERFLANVAGRPSHADRDEQWSAPVTTR